MAKRVVISHFFNEAYLLPWWLKHHREMFDHGVLIDWSSTDGSADICRQLAPSWEVVASENAHFAAILCDFEVMKHEARFPDAWKIALNTTEFLVAPALAHMEATLERHELTAVRLPGAIMVDSAPDEAPDPGVPLTQQKQCGIWEDEFDFKTYAIPGLSFPTRSRIHHRYVIGAYTPGRHGSHCPRNAPATASSAPYGGTGSARGPTPSRRASCISRRAGTPSTGSTASAPSTRPALPTSRRAGASSARLSRPLFPEQLVRGSAPAAEGRSIAIPA